MKIGFLIFLLSTSFVFASGNDSAFDDTVTVTPEEESMADDYVHQGKANTEYAEMCADENNKYKDICVNNDSAFSDGGNAKIEQMLPVVKKMYSMIVMFGGANFSAHKEDTKGNKMYTYKNSDDATITKGIPEGEKVPEDAEPAKEEKTDYCSIIATGIETVNSVYMQVQNQKAEENYVASQPEARQAASFYSLAKSHDNMAETSKNSKYLWGGVAGCYGAMLMTMNISGDWKVYAKLAGSAYIANFYGKKEDAHKERAKLLREMAKKLPQAGDCNPITDTSCFCAEPTSPIHDLGNYKKYCVPNQLADRTTPNQTPYICLDKDKKPDVDCQCSKTNTCVDKVFKMAGLKMGVSPNLMKNPLKSLKVASQGFDDGTANTATKNSLALAKKALEQYKPKGDLSLNTEQKAMANEILKAGIPKTAAALVAKAKVPRMTASIPASMGSLNSTGQNSSFAKAIPPKVKTQFKKKNFAKGGGSSTSKRKNNSFNRFKRKTKKTSGVAIEDFATKAQREAEIVQDSGKMIFDIISYRYKMSAWQKFSEQFKTDQEKK